MDRNLVLAVGLSILIYMGWFSFLEKRYGRPPRPVAAGAAQPAPMGSPAPPPSPAPELPSFRLMDGGVSLAVSPKGAALTSFQYPESLGKIELVRPGSGLFATFPEANFSQVGGPSSAVFEATLPSGVKVAKRFEIAGPERIHSLRLTFRNPGKAPVSLADWGLAAGPGLGTVASEEKENSRLWQALALLKAPAGEKVDPLAKVKLKGEDQSHSEPWRWMGLDNRYFLLAMFPPPEFFSGFDAGSVKIGSDLAPWLRARGAALTLAPGASASVSIPFYLGPKDYTRLREFGLGLERSIDFGWFDPIGRAALKSLRWFYGLTGNWGWSIILLTFALQFVLFPFTYKSFKSMAAMRKIQPEMTRLQQQFGKDSQRLNREMLELYKKHGANPLGGCLPMLAQMPIVVALYNTLRNAWELHGARWVFWIKDLSAHDPFYVLPLVMGGMMFLQGKANPQPSTDPSQAQMMAFMPVIMTFMFLNVPSGLVLYWLTSSTLNFGQQMLLRRRF